jgi:hypothetical protein
LSCAVDNPSGCVLKLPRAEDTLDEPARMAQIRRD